MKQKEFKVGDRVSFWAPDYMEKIKGTIIQIISETEFYIDTPNDLKFYVHPKNLKKIVKRKKTVLEGNVYFNGVMNSNPYTLLYSFTTNQTIDNQTSFLNKKAKLIIYE